MITALKRWVRPTRFAGYCTRPGCRCGVPSKEACDSYEPMPDSAGVVRCACCGNLKQHHAKSAYAWMYRKPRRKVRK